MSDADPKRGDLEPAEKPKPESDPAADKSSSLDSEPETRRAVGELLQGILKRLPEGERTPETVAEFAAELSIVIQRHHSGPLPTPEMLAEYERVCPGLAERIVASSEREQQFRHDVIKEDQAYRRTDLEKRSGATWLGQILGFIVSLLAIGGGVYGISVGYDIAGLASIVLNLAILAGVFLGRSILDYLAKKRDVSSDDDED